MPGIPFVPRLNSAGTPGSPLPRRTRSPPAVVFNAMALAVSQLLLPRRSRFPVPAPGAGRAGAVSPMRSPAARRRYGGGGRGGGGARAHVRVPRATGRSRRDVTVLADDVRRAHALWPRRFCVT